LGADSVVSLGWTREQSY
jgi:hypothetical protein